MGSFGLLWPFGKKGLEAFTRVQLSCICVKGMQGFHIYASVCRISLILPTGKNSLPKNAEFTICMNGNGFLLSKYMFAEAQKCQSQEEATGKGCRGRMMSLVRQGPASSLESRGEPW